MRIRQTREKRDTSWRLRGNSLGIHELSAADAQHDPSERATPAIQPKLTIGRQGDQFEREADDVAEQVVEMSGDDAQPESRTDSVAAIPVQRAAEPSSNPTPAPDDDSVSPNQPQSDVAPDIVHEVLRSGGEPLSREAQRFMEPRFGHDFSQVRVHTDGSAAESARSVNARAFTTGRDVVFGAGQYSPGTAEGRRLIAHELTHVVQQQSMGKARVQRDDNGSAGAVQSPPERGTAAAGYARFLISIPESMARSVISGLTDLLFLNKVRNELILLEAEAPENAARIRAISDAVEAQAQSASQANSTASAGPGATDTSALSGLGSTTDQDMSSTGDGSAPHPGISGAEGTGAAGAEGTKVESYGIAYKNEGVNLRDQPSSHPDSKVLERLEFNTRMYVDSEVDGHYFVGTDGGKFGYVATTHVGTNLPEPNAMIYHIEPGDTALEISRKHYGGEARWGSDHRFYVNGLVYVNGGEGQRGIFKRDPEADWDTTEVRAGYMIWVPSLQFMRSLRGVVKSESISYEAWQTVKSVAETVGEFLLGAGAFVVGLLHGALESVWDIFVGLKDLAVLAWDLVKWLFGLITGDSKSLFDSLKDIEWGKLVQGWIDDFEAKWNDDSILKRWHFRGWVMGYAIAEAIMLIFSGGIIQGIKWVGKSAKVAKVISQMPRIAKLGETAKASQTGQRLSRMLKGGSMGARAANKFVAELLQKPASIWGKGPDEIADAFRSVGYTVNVQQSSRGSKLSKQIRISKTPEGAPQISRIQVHPGGGRHGGSYYKISSSESWFGTKWVADRATFKVQAGMDASKIVWVDSGPKGWMLRAVVANSAAQRAARDED